MDVLLQDCTGARMLPNCTTNFFDYKTERGYTRTVPNFTAACFYFLFEGFCTFLTTRPYGVHYQAAGGHLGFEFLDYQTIQGQPI